VSGQRDPWKQLFSLILEAAPEYAVYGVEQLPGNGNKRLQTSFLSSLQAREKGLCVGIATRCDQGRHVKRSSQMAISRTADA